VVPGFTTSAKLLRGKYASLPCTELKALVRGFPAYRQAGATPARIFPTSILPHCQG